MSAFEFFFSLYGLILGLSVAAIATGVASVFEHRRDVRVGYLTPLLAVFVSLDIASFWENAWSAFRGLPFSYGLLIFGMAVAIVYFVAASLVFPRDVAAAADLDVHFWRNKRAVLLLTTLANALALAMILLTRPADADGEKLAMTFAVTGGLYLAMILPAAFSRRAWLVALLVGGHAAIYLFLAVATFTIEGPTT